MKPRQENYLVSFLLFNLFIAFLVVIFNTENSFGGGDHFNHFKHAYWGWKYPELLFTHWAKPIFTILISPFAQFGINGARIYNVILGIFTSFLCWKIAKLMRFNSAWVVILLVIFTPIYFILMFTSLTEVTFSFLLVLSILLFLKEKYIWSAIVLSFLPLARTEGVIIIPLFVLAYVLKKEYKAIPFLLAGFFLISISGWPFYDNFFWLITKMPYTGSAKEIYGSGSIFHFIYHTSEILGYFIATLFLIGTIKLNIDWGVKERFALSHKFYFILLGISSFLLFFISHSVAWWMGIGNSVGLIRVIGSVTPLAALTATASISWIFDYKKNWWVITANLIMISLLIKFSIDATKIHRYGFSESNQNKTIKECLSFIEYTNLDTNKIYFYSIYTAFYFNIDPKDHSQGEKLYTINSKIINKIPFNSLIIWDAHFGPNEGRTPLEYLKANPDLILIKEFYPQEPISVLGGHEYKVALFQRINESEIHPTNDYANDFEYDPSATSLKSYNGKKSIQVDNINEYADLFNRKLKYISDSIENTTINVRFAISITEYLIKGDLIFVCSAESNVGNIFYKAFDLSNNKLSIGNWNLMEFDYTINNFNSMNDKIKIYFWNKGSTNFFVDDVQIHFSSAE